jgi:hypothetical protein
MTYSSKSLRGSAGPLFFVHSLSPFKTLGLKTVDSDFTLWHNYSSKEVIIEPIDSKCAALVFITAIITAKGSYHVYHIYKGCLFWMLVQYKYQCNVLCLDNMLYIITGGI